MHNNASINNTAVINFPFSDRDLVLCKCNFKTSKLLPTIIYSRNNNEKSLNQMLEEVSGIDFKTLKERHDLNIRRDIFKSIINKVIDKIAALKNTNERKDKNVPWFDSERHRAQFLCSKLYKIFK